MLLEYEAVARREAAFLWANPARVEAVLDFLAATATEHAISFRWRPHPTDPNDDFILELALATGARYVLTHNPRNFAKAEGLGIVPLPPGRFLGLLNAANL